MLEMSITGDPFVDVGTLVMNALPQETVPEKIEYVTDIYVDKWKGSIHSVFLHSKITHIRLKGKPATQKSGSLEYYLGLLKDRGAVTEGFCRICARHGPLFEAGRNNYPLVGSGELVNFHHQHEASITLCKHCLISLYFVPMGILQSGDKLALLQIQNKYTRIFWQEEVILNNLDRTRRGTSEGILKSSYTNPKNALIHFATKIVLRFELVDLPPQQVRLFFFTNFGNKVNVEIYDLPNTVFSFLKRMLRPDLKSCWLSFVKRHYRLKSTFRFDEETKEWFAIKDDSERIEEEKYAGKYPNSVYDCLLSGRSILGLLCRMHKAGRFPILIAITYLMEVRGMRQEQVDLIKNISDKIIALAQEEGDYKKFITPIEGARHSYDLRAAILRMVKKQFKDGSSEPFIRLDDYVRYLFPDGQRWGEVRDLMLICLYEKLHELRVVPTEISDENIPDAEDGEDRSIDELNQ